MSKIDLDALYGKSPLPTEFYQAVRDFEMFLSFGWLEKHQKEDFYKILGFRC